MHQEDRLAVVDVVRRRGDLDAADRAALRATVWLARVSGRDEVGVAAGRARRMLAVVVGQRAVVTSGRWAAATRPPRRRTARPGPCCVRLEGAEVLDLDRPGEAGLAQHLRRPSRRAAPPRCRAGRACSVTSRPSRVTFVRAARVGASTVTTWVVPADRARSTRGSGPFPAPRAVEVPSETDPTTSAAAAVAAPRRRRRPWLTENPHRESV